MLWEGDWRWRGGCVAEGAFDWQSFAVALCLGLLFLVLGLVLRIAQQTHDAASFRKDHRLQIGDMVNKVGDLHKWHDQRDEDGVFVWVLRRSLERQISELATAVRNLSESIKETKERK